jgi:hypothetical protein
MTSIHLGFDMGIRNLAYCLIRHTGDVWNVEAWDNIDLLEGGTSSQDAKRCGACSSPAKWIGPDAKKWCQACATGVRRKKTAKEIPALQTLPCDCSVKALRALAIAGGSDTAKKAKKEELLAWAAARHLMPWKPAKAMDSSLQDIRRAMDSWLNSVLPTFRAATLIRLENQPVMKGPTMKSVQMILFTLLSHRLEREYGWTGAIEFVHAGVKTKEAEGRAPVPATAAPAAAPLSSTAEESAAYRARKKTAETEVIDILTKSGERVADWLVFFNGRSKKSDLADAFLMAMRR